MSDNPYLVSMLPDPPADPDEWDAYRAALADVAEGSPQLKEEARKRLAEPPPPAPTTPEARTTDHDPESFRRA